MKDADHKQMLDLLGGKRTPTAEEFKKLIVQLDSHNVLSKVFLLEGTPFVFEKSPMKYIIFKEQVGDRFGIGSQDVCIVGSAKLGFSPSPHKYGQPFGETSDVDVVIISEPLFDRGSRELFAALNQYGPQAHEVRPHLREMSGGKISEKKPVVDLRSWMDMKEAIRNYVYQNFNPGLLPNTHILRREIFENISSTAGLFLALEPQVFVSKIRGRIFRTWKSAEDYYANTLREAKRAFVEGAEDVETDNEETADLIDSSMPAVQKKA